MEMTKQEIVDTLERQRGILRALRQRLHQRKLQEAQQGINTPPEVMTEIHDLTERVQNEEAETARLETVAAEAGLSLAEAEYRWLLAQAWDTEVGWPTVTNTTKLEYDRLRLKITFERAKEFELEIRIAKATEKINSVPKELFELSGLKGRQFVDEYLPLTESEIGLRLIGSAVRLHPATTIHLLSQRLPKGRNLKIKWLGGALLAANRVWPDQEEHKAFEQFLADLEAALTKT